MLITDTKLVKIFCEVDDFCKEFDQLFQRGLKLVTKIQRNMKNKLISLEERLLLDKRGIVESVFNLMKFICDIEHTRHRSPTNAYINIFAGIASYSYWERKPNFIL